ncbi:MAG: DUF4332 domain-containing protein [Nitrospinota bacterium]|nr:DUF4332 domain-containing protein [Nitrospinota bacterium]
MGKSIVDIEGIGKVYGDKLRAAGSVSVASLLKAGGSRKGRNDLAKATGISPKIIMRCVNMADLFRIRGVASQYAELLEASGVDTVKELGKRKASSLAAKMKQVNDTKNLCNVCPGEKVVAGWIDQAKNLKPAVTY